MADGDTPDTLAGAQDPAALSEQTPIGGTPVNLPRPQQQQPIRAPNLADYRMPNIARLIAGIANANKPMPNQQPGQPPMMRPSRLDAFEDFLGNFMYSLSQGMAASGHGPGANLRGAAAAIGAPMQRDVQQYGLQQNAANMQAQREAEQARTGLTQAETQKTGVDVQLLQRRLAMMQPGAMDAYIKASTSSLGELSDDEKAQIDASKADAGMTGDFKAVNAAVESIARNRAISGRSGAGVIVQDPNDQKFYRNQYDRGGNLIRREEVPIPAGYLKMTQGAAGPAVVNTLNAAPQGGKPARSVGLGAPSMGGITLVDRGNGPEYALKSQALGVAPGKPLDATERYKINTNDVAMVNAIQRMEGIYNNADVISSMLDAGKISFAIGADGTLQAAVGRGVKLTEREKTFAKDFQSMSEDINLLRLPMGGAGFRSEEAFAALQAQRGRLMQNPDVFKGVVGNSLKTLRELHEANQNALRTKSGGGGGGGASNKGTPLTIDEARIYLNRAGGDKDKARALAKSEGKSF